MGARNAILDAFCLCVTKHPADTISVGMICAEAGVSKKTYYNHFESRQALIEAVIERDFFAPQRQMRATLSPSLLKGNTQMLLQLSYDMLQQNWGFYRKLIEEMGEEAFASTFSSLSYSINVEIYTPESELDEESRAELDYLCMFLARTSAHSLLWWAKRGFAPSAEKAADLQYRWSFKYLETGGTSFPDICAETAKNSAPRRYS